MEENLRIYEDIAKRTEGDIYVGVVGPVRTGKSTFIKNFMDLLVIPNIKDSYKQERAKDELPQSASGKTIMTTEPKFIPNEAIEINLANNVTFKTRLVDCVGYLVNNAIGYLENDMPRMVKTPWFDEEIPFEQAAEIGTQKVIQEHSSIGILVTTDGSITDIPRADYVEAEEKTVAELKALHKPFVIVLNSSSPDQEETLNLAKSLEQKYESPVLICNCAQLTLDDINKIFNNILYEFPIDRINISFSRWVDALNSDHWLKKELYSEIKSAFSKTRILKDINTQVENLTSSDVIKKTAITNIALGTGMVNLSVELLDNLFYKVLSEISGLEILNEEELFTSIADLSKIKKEYSKISDALNEVYSKGYGIVTPSIDELVLAEPEMVKQGTRFGVKLKATAPSIHMIRANVETEVSPVVGSQTQSEELVKYLLSEFENDPKKIWESNIFGKSLHELVNEGLQSKLYHMPEEAREKIQETLERIINEGSGGLICIIL